MAKGKDFFGKDVSEAIRQACRELSAAQENLDIEVLETGSAGIFGLCRKKAHIRVTIKPETGTGKEPPEKPGRKKKRPAPEKSTSADKKSAESGTPEEAAPQQPAVTKENAQAEEKPAPAREEAVAAKSVPPAGVPPAKATSPREAPGKEQPAAPAPEGAREPPSAEVLEAIRSDLEQMLTLMGYPSRVSVAVEDLTVRCQISSEHEEAIIGTDGRTLDSLQYLLRKMLSRRLPDRVMLTVDAGNFRQRRAEELKERARELAGQVREDGKTRAIPALNPSERRVVHMTLQEDKTIRSRSVGDGLFKKVLIYRPGKDKKSGSRKRRGRQSDRSSSGN